MQNGHETIGLAHRSLQQFIFDSKRRPINMEHKSLDRKRHNLHGHWKNGIEPRRIPSIVDERGREHSNSVYPDDRGRIQSQKRPRAQAGDKNVLISLTNEGKLSLYMCAPILLRSLHEITQPCAMPRKCGHIDIPSVLPGQL